MIKTRPSLVIPRVSPFLAALVRHPSTRAITYYLGHRAEIDAYLKAANKEYEAFRQRVRAEYPRLSRKLDSILSPTQAPRL